MKRGRRNLNLDYRALYERYLAGESGTSLAAEVGINYTGLYRYWGRRGWARRSQSDAKLLLFEQRPELKAHIKAAQEARRGRTDPMERRKRRALTREQRMLGTSALEDRLADYFDSLGVEYVRQKAIGPYNVDFALPAVGIVIEVDGGGHNPRVRANRRARQEFIETEDWYYVALRLHKSITGGVAVDRGDESQLMGAIRLALKTVRRPQVP